MVKPRSSLLAVLHCAAVALVVVSSTAVTEIIHADAGAGNAGLLYNFYQKTCPQVESIVSRTLLPVFLSDPRSPAAFLRLFFHDCLVQGCDASILLDSNNGEMASSKNFGIRNRELIQLVNSLLEEHCPGVVSCADIIALAAREAVAFSGGPCFDIPLGRKDGTISSFLQADKELPSPEDGVDRTLKILSSKGMSIEESVAIIGAHTIGVGHCLNIVHRLYDGEERRKDNMDYGYEIMLRLKCPFRVPISNETFVANDLTSLIFDNQYYKDIVSGRGLFTVDSEMSLDPRTAPFVKMFAEDQEYFFRAFSMAFVKLSSSVALSGEIRRVCNRVN